MNERSTYTLTGYRTENHFVRGLPGLLRTMTVPQILAETAAATLARRGAGIVVLAGGGIRKRLVNGRCVSGLGPFLIN